MKKIKEEIKVKEINNTVEIKTCSKVEKLDYDFGRGDLNLMRDKINEIIESKCQ